jgi:hypothetical protein
MSRAYGRIGAASAGNSTRNDDVMVGNSALSAGLAQSIRAVMPSLSERIISQVQEAISLADIADERLSAVQNNILRRRDLTETDSCGERDQNAVPSTFEDDVLERLSRLLEALRSINSRSADIRERL